MKTHISTIGNLSLKYLVCAFFVEFGVLFFGCKSKDVDPEYVSIPDVNFEKALIDLKIDDVQDGKVLRASLVKVIILDVTGGGKENSDKIRNLTGIEAMINLNGLRCNFNLIEKLDLTKNKNLTILNCDFNLITTLDISNNLLLKDLNCSVNKINSLDVTKNTSLIDLLCADNLLTTLDVSQNTLLEGLSCVSNKLTLLNITQNKQLENLNCDSNKLISLDVSNNMNLISLYCSFNNLTGLNVSKNPFLRFFECTDNKIQTICVNNLSQVTSSWYKDPTATYKVCP
jgi:hypothetical protein